MRHHKIGRKLNRTSSHRHGMFRNMSISLLEHGFINTTVYKAKELRKFFEPLITLAKYEMNQNNNNKKVVHIRRQIFKKLNNKKATKQLFEKVVPCYKMRNGGYIRILKNGYRYGDKAPMAIMQLVDYKK